MRRVSAIRFNNGEVGENKRMLGRRFELDPRVLRRCQRAGSAGISQPLPMAALRIAPVRLAPERRAGAAGSRVCLPGLDPLSSEWERQQN